MRIAWAIPCGQAHRPSPGRLDLYECNIDTVVVASLGTEVEFDVAIRVVGTESDFATRHVVQVIFRDPQLVVLQTLDLPVPLLVPGPHRLPGYELSTNVGAQVAFHPAMEGGYDLSFALDGIVDARCSATIAVEVGPIST